MTRPTRSPTTSGTPSGDQSSPLVYQGSVMVPDLCGGSKVSLAKGGTFTATPG